MKRLPSKTIPRAFCTSTEAYGVSTILYQMCIRDRNMSGDILVYLREGTYEITEPMQFGVEDSGSNGYYVV